MLFGYYCGAPERDGIAVVQFLDLRMKANLGPLQICMNRSLQLTQERAQINAVHTQL